MGFTASLLRSTSDEGNSNGAKKITQADLQATSAANKPARPKSKPDNGDRAKKITQADLQATSAANKPAKPKSKPAKKISLDALEATAAASLGGRGRGQTKAASTADGGDTARDAKPQRVDRPKKGRAKPSVVKHKPTVVKHKGTPPPQRRSNTHKGTKSGPKSAMEHHKGGHSLDMVHFAGADAAPAKDTVGKGGRNANDRRGRTKSAAEAHKGTPPPQRRSNNRKGMPPPQHRSAVEHHKSGHALEKVRFAGADTDAAPAKPARGNKFSKRKTSIEQHKGQHEAHFADAHGHDAHKRGGKSTRTTRKPAVKAAVAQGKDRGGKRTSQKPRVKSAPAQPSKAKATPGRNNSKVKPPAGSQAEVVYSECGRDHHEVVGRVDPIHHQTLGGIRRLRHGSWAVAINSPWLDGKPATNSGKASPAKRASEQKLVLTHVDTQDGRHSMQIAGDVHPIHDQTLGGQRAQKHASWRASVDSAWLDSDDDAAAGDDNNTAPAPMPPHIANANVSGTSSREKKILTHTEDGRMSLPKKKGGGDYHPVHDLTLGGQRRQKHNSWSAAIASDWQKDVQERGNSKAQQITHFVSIPITDEQVHQNLVELQNRVITKAPANKSFRFPPAKFHISVAMIRKPAEMSMDDFESQLAYAFHDIEDIVAETLGNPVNLKLGAPSTFRKDVAIVNLQSGDAKLVSHLSLVIYEQLTMRGINIDPPNSTPHITLFKRSQIRKSKDANAFDAKAIMNVKRRPMGVEPCEMVDLCCMKGSMKNQYYQTLASLVL